MRAYSYIRFSSKGQAIGHSLKRQTQLAIDYCNKTGLILDENLNLSDLGVSGYSGANIKTGALGRFIEEVNNGSIEKGSYLLIENLDRFSRLNPREIQPIFQQLLNSGIKIVTLTDEKVFDDNSDFVDMIISILSMQRAFEESDRKSKLVIAAKKSKKDAIRDGRLNIKLTRNCPKWMTLNQDKTKFFLIPDRVAVVQQVYQMSISGYGAHKIISWLNDNIEPWAMNTKNNKVPVKWHNSGLRSILGNKAVIGYLHDIKNYYPNIISQEDFDKEIYIRSKRNTGTSGRRGNNFSNLFIGISKCGYSYNNICKFKNEACSFIGKGKYNYIECYSKRIGTCKRFKGNLWPYDHFEKSMLYFLESINLNDLVKPEKDYDKDLSDLKIKETKLLDNISYYSNLIDSGERISNIERTKLFGFEDDLDVITDKIKLLENKKIESEVSINNKQFQVGMDYDSRMKLNTLLKRYIERIEVFSHEDERGIFILFNNGACQWLTVDRKNYKNLYTNIYYNKVPDKHPGLL